jgi:hypothetical protein
MKINVILLLLLFVPYNFSTNFYSFPLNKIISEGQTLSEKLIFILVVKYFTTFYTN